MTEPSIDPYDERICRLLAPVVGSQQFDPGLAIAMAWGRSPCPDDGLANDYCWGLFVLPRAYLIDVYASTLSDSDIDRIRRDRDDDELVVVLDIAGRASVIEVSRIRLIAATDSVARAPMDPIRPGQFDYVRAQPR